MEIFFGLFAAAGAIVLTFSFLVRRRTPTIRRGSSAYVSSGPSATAGGDGGASCDSGSSGGGWFSGGDSGGGSSGGDSGGSC
ncbi:hypothetical protein [Salinispora pacifica]|uniref:hypothetical protein n=1 Tax=Salinispora pacifica TaxID=351187 RepID=UPI00035E16FC|nr:hypothetical protein [Salinispora pacifica]